MKSPFLVAHGIDEPVAWQPPLTIAGIPEPTPTTVSTNWPQLPNLDIKSFPTLAERYQTGLSLRETAATASVSRDRLARQLRLRGIEPRKPGRPPQHTIDLAWLRHEYEESRHTMNELATQLGVSRATIRDRLSKAGVTSGGRGGAGRARALRRPPPDRTPQLMRRAMLTLTASPRHFDRFLIAADAATLSIAATALNIRISVLSTQLGKLSTAVGGPLFNKAQRGRPRTLTPLGEHLRKEILSSEGEFSLQTCCASASRPSPPRCPTLRVTSPVVRGN